MNKQNQGITNFKLIAAIMVVAIHSFSFQPLSKEWNTIITLTLFRIAVPFFFMVTGFYILGPLKNEEYFPAKQRIFQFLKKQFKIYGVVTFLYLPFALYSGLLAINMPLSQLLQLFFFKGMAYHLWYFPALMLSVIITFSLLKKWSIQTVLAITGTLYVTGLGSDSWSALFQPAPLANPFYEFLFPTSPIIRNGLFFAPLFLTLGAFLYQKKITQPPKTYLLVGSLFALLAGGALLNQFSIPYQNSTYIFLPFVMYFLFPFIFCWQPKKCIRNGTAISFGIYILHPYLIALVHTMSYQIPLLENSILSFLVTLLLTYGMIVAVLKVKLVLGDLFFQNKLVAFRASKKLSKEALLHNLKEIKSIIPKTTKLMAVVKANAYGTDAPLIASILEKEGADFFAVATIDEGIALRKAKIKSRILVLGYTSPSRIKELRKYSLTQSIISEEHANALNKQKVKIKCHLKVDTGMHRLGVEPNTQKIKQIYGLPFLSIEGLFSHLGSSDELTPAGIKRTEQQIAVYNRIIEELNLRNVKTGITHIQSSYGILNYPHLNYDYVRPGITLYGFLSNGTNKTRTNLALQPTVEVKAQLISKKRIEANEYIGYGTTMSCSTRRLIGVVSIGYCDGVPRELSSAHLQLSFDGQLIPQIGKICMDMLLVDLSGLEEIPIEAELTVFPDLMKIADHTRTITNELLSRLGSRLEI